MAYHDDTDIHLAGLVERLQREVQTRIFRRAAIEARWLRDIAQYEGLEDEELINELNNEGKSHAVINLTRAKCNTFISKLVDMLFPTDSKNWGISPTPVPEFDHQVSRMNIEVNRLTRLANVEEDEHAASQHSQEADSLATRIREFESLRATMRQKADLMMEEIDDNLVECDYAGECRKVIFDGTVCGTGILKGPLPLSEQVRKNWKMQENGKYRMEFEIQRPDRMFFQHVSFWNCYPDLMANDFDHVDSWLERHVLSRRNLQELARQPDVNLNSIRSILEEGPQDQTPQFMTDLKFLSQEQTNIDENMFTVWEYRGPVEPEEMKEIMSYLMNNEAKELNEVEIDPLVQLDAVVWFCQGRIIKLGINHLDDNSSVYSIFQIEKSVARLWGIGLPSVMRSQATILNGAWRSMIDNARFASFPITEVNTSVVRRLGGGNNVLKAGSTWERKAGAANEPGFVFHNFPVHQEYYANIVQMITQFVDQETNVSALASGEQGSSSRTAGGMALLMNSVNVVFRRIVKNFDDGITIRSISKAYDFLMQFSPKDEIKGDYRVQAHGSSILLVREVQAQNLLVLATQISLHPILGGQFRMREIAKALCGSMMLPADQMLKTQQEIEMDEAAELEAQRNAPPDPEIVKLQLQQELAQLETETKLQLAQMRGQGDLTGREIQARTALEQIAARLQMAREQAASRERIFAAEAAIEARTPSAGGSGGYLA